jgi:hypothetical protein
MFFRQKIFAVFATLCLLLFIFELVRRRKMREEYSFLWIITGVSILILIIWYDLLIILSKIIGAVAPTTTLFIFAIIFLMLICINFSIKISSLTDQLIKLTQDLALLKLNIRENGKN